MTQEKLIPLPPKCFSPLEQQLTCQFLTHYWVFYESMYEITAKEEGITGRECHSHDSNHAEHENKKKRDNDSVLKVPVLSFEKNRVSSSSTKSLFHIQMPENPYGSIRELIKLKFVFRRYGELV